jgi:hypothetical protein
MGDTVGLTRSARAPLRDGVHAATANTQCMHSHAIQYTLLTGAAPCVLQVHVHDAALKQRFRNAECRSATLERTADGAFHLRALRLKGGGAGRPPAGITSALSRQQQQASLSRRAAAAAAATAATAAAAAAATAGAAVCSALLPTSAVHAALPPTTQLHAALPSSLNVDPGQQLTLALQQGRSGALCLPISVGGSRYVCAVDTGSPFLLLPSRPKLVGATEEVLPPTTEIYGANRAGMVDLT